MIDKNLRDAVFSVLKDCDFVSIRAESRRDENIVLESGVFQPMSISSTNGVQVIVVSNGGYGYASTRDITLSGLQSAALQARDYARLSSEFSITDYSKVPWPHPKGQRNSVVSEPWCEEPLSHKKDRIQAVSRILASGKHVVDHEVSLWNIDKEVQYFTSEGGEVVQTTHSLVPMFQVTGEKGNLVQTRTFGFQAYCMQGGMELLDRLGFQERSEKVVVELEELLAAPNCPTGVMDIVCAPDQMILQIHESIGHPIEMDRILGDERNYAGTSFVTKDMFGSYQYGSPLLNITFDPSINSQIASYDYDDEGKKAEKTYLIKDGILLRPLGGIVSESRSGLPSVANARSTQWNRAPIDRMANLNLEVGNKNLKSLIGEVEDGVYVETNCSWSIDDSRNKFQFGCEFGRRIRKGELAEVVRNPNYRGISADFWRNLKAVGDQSTFEVMGTPYCGKGEPNQAIHVGHASPACLFSNISVFGGM